MQPVPEGHDLGHLRRFIKVIQEEFGRPLGTAIDGGANRGVWTKELLKHFDEVVAIESRLEMFEKLKEACPDAKCIHAALWDKSGEKMLNDYHGQNVGASHVVPSEVGETVTIALDDTPYTMDFLKLDIEGAELHALRGARKKIALYQPAIMVEMNINGERFFNTPNDYLKAFLDGLNYELCCRENKDYLYLPR